MRMLHTSDWHVGRTFHGQDLLADQEAVLGGLAEIVASAGVDLVLLAGDVYDRAMPSADAVRVCHRALARIRAAGAQIVLIPGNHDSSARLGFGADFMAAGGVHVISSADGIGRPVLLADEHGPVAVYGIPYLEPETARHALLDPAEDRGRRGHTAVLSAAMGRIRADLAVRAVGQDRLRSVVVAHAFVVGGAGCDSERSIAAGGVQTVAADVFAGPDYVALGHLHGRQTITQRIQYSGSPLPYSFSESDQSKSVLLVELDADGLSTVTPCALDQPRKLALLTGRLADLLSDPAHESLREHYVSAVLTDQARPVEAMRELRTRFPHAVHVDWRPAEQADSSRSYAQRVRGRDDLGIAEEFLAHVRGERPGRAELDLFSEAFRAVRLASLAGEDRQR